MDKFILISFEKERTQPFYISLKENKLSSNLAILDRGVQQSTLGVAGYLYNFKWI